VHALRAIRRGSEPFDAEKVCALARRALRRPLDGAPRPGLVRLCESLDAEARLSHQGRLSAWAQLVRTETNRLEVLDRPLVAPDLAWPPLVITGLPRSGTTHLFTLLSLDTRHRVPRRWETLRPAPPPGPEASEASRIAEAERHWRFVSRQAPRLERIHPLPAQLPEECLALTAPCYESHLFKNIYRVPGYQDWLEARDPRVAYGWHRRMLGVLGAPASARRWVLKAPSHMFALEALIETYPDVRIVHTHRKPSATLPSMASLVCALRGLASDEVDPRGVGPTTLERWARGLRHGLEVRDAEAEERFFDLRHDDLCAQPIASLRAIYEWLQVPVADELEERWRAHLAGHPRHAAGVHRYALEEYGLRPEDIDARFADYTARFDLR
jgi:hypothetical protein